MDAREAIPAMRLHAVVVAFGAAVLVWFAWPLSYDGLLSTDGFAASLLALAGSLLMVAGGVVEGALERVGRTFGARIALAAFAVVGVYPPLLMSARWFASDGGEPSSSSSLGLALVMWLLTVAGEYGVARAVGGRALDARPSGFHPRS